MCGRVPVIKTIYGIAKAFSLCNLVTPAAVWDLMIELAKPALIQGNAIHSIPRSCRVSKGFRDKHLKLK